MGIAPSPLFLNEFWQDAFALKLHLQEFLGLETAQLTPLLESGCRALAQLGQRDFSWDRWTQFYGSHVGDAYFFDLAAWHLTNPQDYIGNTVRLVADFAQGRVLDFGGGIGTHSLAAAQCPKVTQVVYCDINPRHQAFVEYRASQLGLTDKIICQAAVLAEESFDTILCFDVLEHLPDPSAQLLQFYDSLQTGGCLVTNWYFFQGFDREYPFHLDYREQPQTVAKFYGTLRQHFLEVFHPYLSGGRCYRKELCA
ncbi:class I SAM-dependent methyltransferase [Anthocerotibacter panamensis]|uniref:class I SAM-dependent methyltransferase n=1 Tax=Anthocerotibacter panamensis TaxID=2857077 RepID=UPI001C403399|nr:methyltransferase domain-containing protein [Anthocerotibacter panamensis]